MRGNSQGSNTKKKLRVGGMCAISKHGGQEVKIWGISIEQKIPTHQTEKERIIRLQQEAWQ